MLILPAIDLMNGACVRLEQGAFENATRYQVDPLVTARSFEEAGARWLHLVDLDGARTGKPKNRDWVQMICRESGLKVQTGGGIRSEFDAAEILRNGVDRAVLGSLAVRDPEAIFRLVDRFGADRITVALDIRPSTEGFEIAVDGWQSSAGEDLLGSLAAFREIGARHLLVTDISRDGMLMGANIPLYSKLAEDFPDFAFQASGGISSTGDLAKIKAAGAAAAIVGRAIYEDHIGLEELFDAD
jgi:phosphoribosylformimino-5-aminoimidazole carboxamide ribotide isomerase